MELVEKAKRTTTDKIDALKKDIRQLEAIIEEQRERLAHKSKPLFRSPAKHKPSHKHFNRVLIPDSHGAHIDQGAAAALLADLEYLQPAEVVWMGDHLDCGGFLAMHHTIGFVAETAVEWPDDIDAANQFIDQVQKRTPKAVHHFLTGNHEHRIERWCCTQALAKQRTAQWFLDRVGVRAVLNLDARGIIYHPRGELESEHKRLRGAIKLGNCYFVHDVSTASDPCSVALNRYAANVAFGDTHRLVYRVGRKAEKDIFAATIGHIATQHPYWNETNVTDWSHGYGLQIVAGPHEVLHINVPICNGRSLLGPLIGAVK